MGFDVLCATAAKAFAWLWTLSSVVSRLVAVMTTGVRTRLAVARAAVMPSLVLDEVVKSLVWDVCERHEVVGEKESSLGLRSFALAFCWPAGGSHWHTAGEEEHPCREWGAASLA